MLRIHVVYSGNNRTRMFYYDVTTGDKTIQEILDEIGLLYMPGLQLFSLTITNSDNK